MNLRYHVKPYSIRQATETDYEKISYLLQSVDLPLEGVEENINNFLLLFDGNRLIGTVGLEIYGKSALLRSLAVNKDYQGMGYGKILYQNIFKQAREMNILNLYLLTDTAEGFFSSLGFKTISRERVDKNVKSSVEFQVACPQSATCMYLRSV